MVNCPECGSTYYLEINDSGELMCACSDGPVLIDEDITYNSVNELGIQITQLFLI